ncbi:MAG: hypothetical protein AAGH15_18690 [Myxococcota bacterium]
MVALPPEDPIIEALEPSMRQALAGLWEERASSELKAGSGFALLVTELFEVGAALRVLELATRAAADEVRHASLCRALAERYKGAPVPEPQAKRVGMPSHPGAPRALLPHLHAVGLSCINETLAAAFVRACLQHAESPCVRAVQKAHLEDEIVHARIGWAHLATLDAATRAEVGRFVPRLLSANRRVWRERLGILPATGVPGHGIPPRAELHAVVDATLDEVIAPGFAHVNVPVA